MAREDLIDEVVSAVEGMAEAVVTDRNASSDDSYMGGSVYQARTRLKAALTALMDGEER